MRTLALLTTVFLTQAAASAQIADPEQAIPGGDQFAPENRFTLDPTVKTLLRDYIRTSIPGGDQFDATAPIEEQIAFVLAQSIPGGDRFETNLDLKTQVELLLQRAIPGGDQFIPGGDQFVATMPLEKRLVLALESAIPGGDQFIPGGDQFIDDELPEGLRSGGSEIPVLDHTVGSYCDWTGIWGSTYGNLRLIQKGANVSGDYSTKGFISGEVGLDCSLKGTFDNRFERLTGRFEFSRADETFEGHWGLDGEPLKEVWKGRRSSKEPPKLYASQRWKDDCNWTGTWNTPEGRMKLIQEGERVRGELGSETISGTTETECAGTRAIRLEAELRNTDDGTTRSMSITMTVRRFVGSIGAGNTIPSGVVFKGSRASRDEPELTNIETTTDAADWRESQLSENDAIVEGAATVSRATDTPGNRQHDDSAGSKSKVARWEVNIGELCQVQSSKNHTGSRMAGIVWVKARIVNKITGKEETIAPVGGFHSVNGDLERVWELRPRDWAKTSQNYITHRGECAAFANRGFGFGGKRTVVFEIDPAEYGYTDMSELESRSSNRIRVLYQLKTTQSQITGVDFTGGPPLDFNNVVLEELGPKGRTHPLQDGDICGTCKIESWIEAPEKRMYGNGLFTQVRSKRGEEFFIAYDIKRLK